MRTVPFQVFLYTNQFVTNRLKRRAVTEAKLLEWYLADDEVNVGISTSYDLYDHVRWFQAAINQRIGKHSIRVVKESSNLEEPEQRTLALVS